MLLAAAGVTADGVLFDPAYYTRPPQTEFGALEDEIRARYGVNLNQNHPPTVRPDDTVTTAVSTINAFLTGYNSVGGANPDAPAQVSITTIGERQRDQLIGTGAWLLVGAGFIWWLAKD